MWKRSPKNERMRAKKIDGDIVDYEHLKKGDFFQTITPDGESVDPITFEHDPHIFAYCCIDPMPSQWQGRGFEVEVDCGYLTDLKRKYSN